MKKEKNIPVLRFPEFKEAWKKNSIENLFDFKNGLNKEKEFFGKGTPIINFTDVFSQNALYAHNVKGLVEVTKKEVENYSAKEGDVFFMRTSETINEIGLSATLMENIKDCVFSGFVLRARPKGYILVNDYKKYCFEVKSVREEIIKRSSYTTRALTSGTLLNKVLFYHPLSLNEQQKIASFLTAVDDKLHALKKKKALLEQYKKGTVQKIFSQQLRFKDDNGKAFPKWEQRKLSEVCDVRDGTHDSPKYHKNGYPFVTSKNLMKNGTLDLSNVSYICEEDYMKINARSRVNVGDILFGMIGTIGNPVLVKRDGFAIKNVALLKENDVLKNIFLIHYLKSPSIMQQFFVQNMGGTQKFLSLNVIRSLTIVVPSIAEQIKIASFLSAIDDKITHCNSQIEKTEQYKKGLLQKMFV